MIQPISKSMKEHMGWHDEYGVTKFIDPATGDGHRGVIVKNDGKTAVLYGLTGEYANRLINVEEVDETQWPHLVSEGEK